MAFYVDIQRRRKMWDRRNGLDQNMFTEAICFLSFDVKNFMIYHTNVVRNKNKEK